MSEKGQGFVCQIACIECVYFILAYSQANSQIQIAEDIMKVIHIFRYILIKTQTLPSETNILSQYHSALYLVYL